MRRAIAAAALVSAICGQAPRAFEVASIKPTNTGDNRVAIMMQPGGRFNATNVTVKMLMQNAYGVRDFQIVGGPGWIGSDRFDITAKLEGDGPLQPDSLRPALQGLLEDRFQLKLHRETREMQTYALLPGKNGPKLQKSADEKAPGPQIRMGRGQLSAKKVTMTILANQLAQQLGRSVVDKSVLTGEFDFELSWTPEIGGGGPFGPDAGGAPPAVDSPGPSIFTAVQEQLGLRLESQRGPVEILVIDRLEKPSEN